MRQLLPAYDEDVELPEAYRYPTDRTWVRANMVASVDGAAVKDGSSRALSGSADQQVLGVLRGLCDVVLAGAGTARSESYQALRAKPAFSLARESLGQRPAPVLALVSRSLDLDPASPLFGGAQRSVVITTGDSDERSRLRLAEVADVVVAGDGTLDVPVAIEELEKRGLRRVLCEGGPEFLSTLASAGRLDELCLTLSPVLVGGDAPRVLGNVALKRSRLVLAHVLEQDGVLFTRYVVD